jgi:hypothetical protein
MSDNDNDEPVGERGPDDPITIRIRDQVSQKAKRSEGGRSWRSKRGLDGRHRVVALF